MTFDWPELFWYRNHPIRWILWPFSLVYQMVVSIRKYCLKRWFKQSPGLPLIVVGNLTVGGVGKTPLVIALANTLTERGLKVGIVSRGYGARVKHFPHEVHPEQAASVTGDEPLLIAKKTGCPVVIAPRRVDAVRWLRERHQVQIIISDDGLQHYVMGRSIEMVVIDGTRKLGNGFCLPAGPLREPASRLKESDFLVVNEGSFPNAFSMNLKPMAIRQLNDNSIVTTNDLKGTIVAVAGIGNPLRFFNTLSEMGIQHEPCPYPDHYNFKPENFTSEGKIYLMTEKDAVKCRDFATSNMYYLSVEAVLSDAFWDAFCSHKHVRDLI